MVHNLIVKKKKFNQKSDGTQTGFKLWSIYLISFMFNSLVEPGPAVNSLHRIETNHWMIYLFNVQGLFLLIMFKVILCFWLEAFPDNCKNFNLHLKNN